MIITFVTESHAFEDDKQTEDVITREEFEHGIVQDHDEHLSKLQGWVDQHGGWLRTHDKSIKGLTDTVKNLNEKMDGLDGQIQDAWNKLDKLPNALRDTLNQILKESFLPQLESFARLVAGLKEEREQVAKQLDDLIEQRNRLRSELDALQKQSATAKALYEDQRTKLESQVAEAESLVREARLDFAISTAELKASVPVPKKFAKFLFVQPDASIEKKG